jgi:membrane protein YqaA with SNARE-associated domain
VPTQGKYEAWKLGLKLLLGATALVLVVALLGHFFHADLEKLGRAFLGRFGYAGIAMGTYIADGLHCPVPPQFYMLAAIASGWSEGWTIVAVCIGSLAGGVTGYLIARKAASIRLFRRLFARNQEKFDWLYERYGYWAVAIGSLTPIPFSFLCYVAGGQRMPPRIFVALSLFRIPKVVLYFYLVKLGWTRAQ